METYTFIISVSLVALGFLVKAFPMLIAGYNTMSPKERAQVDIKGLSSLMRNAFVIMGITILLGTYLFERLGGSMVAQSILPITIIGGILVMLILIQRYNYILSPGSLRKRRLAANIVVGAMVAIVGVIILLGYLPTKVNINSQYIEIKGMYGVDLLYEGIQCVELTNQIPKIQKRTNGFSLRAINKGHFKLDGVGDSRLYLRSLNPPFIQITDHRDRRVYINFSTSDETQRKYNDIMDMIKSKNRL